MKCWLCHEDYYDSTIWEPDDPCGCRWGLTPQGMDEWPIRFKAKAWVCRFLWWVAMRPIYWRCSDWLVSIVRRAGRAS
jgi:hypothetical protein